MSATSQLQEEKFAPHVQSDMLSASVHAMGRADAQGLSPLQGQPPAPPLWRRTQIYPYLIIALVVFGIIGFDAYIRVQTHLNEERLDTLETEFSQQIRLNKAAQESRSEADRLNKEISQVRREVGEMQKRKQALDGLLERQQSAPGMLNALQEAVTDEVMVSRFTYRDRGDGQYFVSAWALSNTAGQLFVNSLGRHLTLWELRVKDYAIRTGSNRFGAVGYEVNVWLESTAKEGSS